MVAATTSGDIIFYDARTLSEQFRLKVGKGVVTGLSFSPDGTRLAFAGDDPPGVVDPKEGKVLFRLDIPGERKVSTDVRFSPDGTHIVVGTNQNKAFLYRAADGELLYALDGRDFDAMWRSDDTNVTDPLMEAVAHANWQIWGTATEVAFSPDGRLVALTGPANPDSSAMLYDAGTGKLVHVLQGGSRSSLGGVKGYGTMLAFSADGKKILAAPTLRSVKIWSAVDGQLTSEIYAPNVTAFFVTADGRGLISGHGNGYVLFHCLDDPFKVASLKAHDYGVDNLTAAKDGRTFVSTSNDHTAKVWALPTGAEICGHPEEFSNDALERLAAMPPLAVFPSRDYVVHKAVYSKDDRSVFTVSRDGYMRKWAIEPGDTRSFDLGGEADGGGSDSRARRLVVFGPDDSIFVRAGFYDYHGFKGWNLKTGDPVALPERTRAIVAAGGPLRFETLEDWTIHPGGTTIDPAYGQPTVWQDDISPDGTRGIASSSNDGDYSAEAHMYLFDAASRALLAPLQAFGHFAVDPFFVGDGSRVLSRVNGKVQLSEGDSLACGTPGPARSSRRRNRSKAWRSEPGSWLPTTAAACSLSATTWRRSSSKLTVRPSSRSRSRRRARPASAPPSPRPCRPTAKQSPSDMSTAPSTWCAWTASTRRWSLTRADRRSTTSSCRPTPGCWPPSIPPIRCGWPILRAPRSSSPARSTRRRLWFASCPIPAGLVVTTRGTVSVVDPFVARACRCE